MSRLSVNINKVATLRNARGGNIPNVINVAQDCERFGADGITVHPRPDERHIRYKDVYGLSKVVKKEFNIEGFPNDNFIRLVLSVLPEQVTLVPDPPGVLTSNSGWDLTAEKEFLEPVVNTLRKEGIRVSLFMGTDLSQLELAKDLGIQRVEFYTGPYAEGYSKNKDLAIKPFVKAAGYAHQLGLGINAGHDLSLENVKYFKEKIPNLLEVSIGHALIADALYYGLENTIGMYKKKLSQIQC